MNKKRYNLALLLLAICSLVLVACSGSKTDKNAELSKRYFQLQAPGTDIRMTYYYEETSDKVIKQTTENKLVYDELGVDQQTLKEMVEPAAEQYKNINGVEHSIQFGDDFMTESLSINYDKVDLKEVQGITGIQISDENASQISMKESAKMLKSGGFKEIKDGKFKESK